MGEVGIKIRRGIAVTVAASVLAATASSASASVSIGQLAPGSPPPGICGPFIQDVLDSTVTDGSSYVVPALPPATALVINSWSHNAASTAGQTLIFKVFRPVSGLTFMAVAHDGPRALTPGALNTFSGLKLPVQPGDVIGLTKLGDDTACIFTALGDSSFSRTGNLADGESGDFIEGGDSRVNIQAVVAPDNTFTRGKVKRNKNKGTATVTLNLPNPGQLTGSGGGAKVAGGAATSKAVPAGQATLVIRAKGKKRTKLNETGKVKVKPKVTYTPTGGDPGTQSLKLKLRKKLKG